MYGGWRPEGSGIKTTEEGVQSSPEPRGWRDAREVIKFLRDRGAKIGDLGDKVEGDWAAVSSDGEAEGLETETEADVIWVASHLTSSY